MAYYMLLIIGASGWVIWIFWAIATYHNYRQRKISMRDY